ncbi:MAG TPA: chromate efflux transporter [Caulobacteraceae bacterium]|nr:chromate efflux transporter [Caulobacteraceae bacterium]
MDVLTLGAEQPPRRGWRAAAEVFAVALGLGLTSFGGPVAHIGYFERAYVRRRGWLSAEAFAGIVALCQTLPGPASSQVGFLVGLRRAGLAGALAAWLGFTLPSALLLFAFALAAPNLTGRWSAAVLHGLQLTAAAVVAQAVWSMARRLCPDLPRATLGVLGGAIAVVVTGPLAQLAALTAGGVGGALLLRRQPQVNAAPGSVAGARAGLIAAGLAAILLLASLWPGVERSRTPLALATLIYRAGALVFGGGHVVLPLLQGALVPSGWLDQSQFLAGYGAAQAVPGPLFTFAAYIGAAAAPAGSSIALRAAWSALALVAIFLPGLLLALGALPLWNWLSRHAPARAALIGINAAVVGVLAAALWRPVLTTAIVTPGDLAIVAATFLLLFRLPPLAIVFLCVASALAKTALAGAL